jgi:hypothetical protein
MRATPIPLNPLPKCSPCERDEEQLLITVQQGLLGHGGVEEQGRRVRIPWLNTRGIFPMVLKY